MNKVYVVMKGYDYEGYTDNDMISIVTGTLNRLGMLPNLISNTVLSDDRLELVLVDVS